MINKTLDTIKNKENLETDLDNENYKIIKNRYGEFKVDLTKNIYFHNGLLGLADHKQYCLTSIPQSDNQFFKLLQSLHDNDVCFVTLPLIKDQNGEFPIIENEDIELVRKDLGINDDDLVVLLIVNFSHKDDGKSDIYVNVRAPIIVDCSKQAGIQYVFATDKYKVKHKISK